MSVGRAWLSQTTTLTERKRVAQALTNFVCCKTPMTNSAAMAHGSGLSTKQSHYLSSLSSCISDAMAQARSARVSNRCRAKPPADASTNDVLVALRRIIRAIDLQSKRVAKESGLTTPQVLILQSIRDLGEVTTGRISEQVNLSQATVTTIMDRLEQRGLVERYRSVKDRRVVHTKLTTAGRQALRRAPPLLHERFVAAFSALDRADRIRVIRTLDEVAAMLGASQLDAAPLLDLGAPSTDKT